MKLGLLLISLSLFNLASSQKKTEIKFSEQQRLKSSNEKYFQCCLDIFVYDEMSKKRFEVILVRINGVSLTLSDTSNHFLLLSPGKHQISFGWVGYEWSKPKKIKVRSRKDYRIESELTSTRSILE
jgi:hypothetical protein